MRTKLLRYLAADFTYHSSQKNNWALMNIAHNRYFYTFIDLQTFIRSVSTAAWPKVGLRQTLTSGGEERGSRAEESAG